jgi:hypothetical protein
MQGDTTMFDSREMQDKLYSSMPDNLNDIFHSSKMDVSPEIAHSICDTLRGLVSADGNDIINTTIKKAPQDLGDSEDGYGAYNVIPAKNKTSHRTDTLVVYCLGSDNLLDRLVDTIAAINDHPYRNVFFITSKWDTSVLTGKNKDRMQRFFEFSQAGTRFCFILVSMGGFSRIK